MRKLHHYSIFLFMLCLGTCIQAQEAKKQPLAANLSLAYTEAGNARETLILLHGLGGNQQHWIRNLPELSQHYRVLALDLPGYGNSPLEQLPQENLLHYFSDVLLSFMDSLSLDKAHLAGHSMGGQLALLFALEHPERVRKLVLAAPAGIETFTEAEAAGLNAYAASVFPQKQTETQIRQSWDLNFHHLPAEAEPLIQERLQLNESAYYPTYAFVLQKGVSGMLGAPIATRLGEIKVPTLILFGAEDKLIPNRYLHPDLTTEAIAKQAQTAIPNSQLVILPEAGHLLQFERPKAFNQEIIKFLKLIPTSKKSTP